jgi:hypothetical protein
LDRFAAVRAGGDQLHAGFRGDERRNALPKERVIVDGQDPDHMRLSAHEAAQRG